MARAVIHIPPDDHSSGNNVLHPAKRTLPKKANPKTSPDVYCVLVTEINLALILKHISDSKKVIVKLVFIIVIKRF